MKKPKKLQIRKITISNLSEDSAREIKGGGWTDAQQTCHSDCSYNLTSPCPDPEPPTGSCWDCPDDYTITCPGYCMTDNSPQASCFGCSQNNCASNPATPTCQCASMPASCGNTCAAGCGG